MLEQGSFGLYRGACGWGVPPPQTFSAGVYRGTVGFVAKSTQAITEAIVRPFSEAYRAATSQAANDDLSTTGEQQRQPPLSSSSVATRALLRGFGGFVHGARVGIPESGRKFKSAIRSLTGHTPYHHQQQQQEQQQHRQHYRPHHRRPHRRPSDHGATGPLIHSSRHPQRQRQEEKEGGGSNSHRPSFVDIDADGERAGGSSRQCDGSADGCSGGTQWPSSSSSPPSPTTPTSEPQESKTGAKTAEKTIDSSTDAAAAAAAGPLFSLPTGSPLPSSLLLPLRPLPPPPLLLEDGECLAEEHCSLTAAAAATIVDVDEDDTGGRDGSDEGGLLLGSGEVAFLLDDDDDDKDEEGGSCVRGGACEEKEEGEGAGAALLVESGETHAAVGKDSGDCGADLVDNDEKFSDGSVDNASEEGAAQGREEAPRSQEGEEESGEEDDDDDHFDENDDGDDDNDNDDDGAGGAVWCAFEAAVAFRLVWQLHLGDAPSMLPPDASSPSSSLLRTASSAARTVHTAAAASAVAGDGDGNGGSSREAVAQENHRHATAAATTTHAPAEKDCASGTLPSPLATLGALETARGECLPPPPPPPPPPTARKKVDMASAERVDSMAEAAPEAAQAVEELWVHPALEPLLLDLGYPDRAVGATAEELAKHWRAGQEVSREELAACLVNHPISSPNHECPEEEEESHRGLNDGEDGVSGVGGGGEEERREQTRKESPYSLVSPPTRRRTPPTTTTPTSKGLWPLLPAGLPPRASSLCSALTKLKELNERRQDQLNNSNGATTTFCGGGGGGGGGNGNATKETKEGAEEVLVGGGGGSIGQTRRGLNEVPHRGKADRFREKLTHGLSGELLRHVPSILR